MIKQCRATPFIAAQALIVIPALTARTPSFRRRPESSLITCRLRRLCISLDSGLRRNDDEGLRWNDGEGLRWNDDEGLRWNDGGGLHGNDDEGLRRNDGGWFALV